MFILCTVCILLSFKTVCSTYPFWYFAYFSAFKNVTISRQEIEFENRTFRHMWHKQDPSKTTTTTTNNRILSAFFPLLNFVKHFQEAHYSWHPWHTWQEMLICQHEVWYFGDVCTYSRYIGLPLFFCACSLVIHWSVNHIWQPHWLPKIQGVTTIFVRTVRIELNKAVSPFLDFLVSFVKNVCV